MWAIHVDTLRFWIPKMGADTKVQTLVFKG